MVIGRSDIHSYGVFPPDGAALVRELAAGRVVDDAADWYADAYGEHVDMDEFVATLHELQLVREPDEPSRVPPPVRYQRLGRALFSTPAWALYGALLAAALFGHAARRAAVPAHGQRLLHGLAGRRRGERVRRPDAAHRAARGVPRAGRPAARRRQPGEDLPPPLLHRSRDEPRRAGGRPATAALPADHGRAARRCDRRVRPDDAGVPHTGRRARPRLALAFTTLPRMAWQLYLFLRTDIYQLIATATGCVDLDTVARGLLANRVNRLLGPTVCATCGAGTRGTCASPASTPRCSCSATAGAWPCWCRDGPAALHFWGSPVLVAMTVAQLAVALAIGRESGARPEGAGMTRHLWITGAAPRRIGRCSPASTPTAGCAVRTRPPDRCSRAGARRRPARPPRRRARHRGAGARITCARETLTSWRRRRSAPASTRPNGPGASRTGSPSCSATVADGRAGARARARRRGRSDRRRVDRDDAAPHRPGPPAARGRAPGGAGRRARPRPAPRRRPRHGDGDASGPATPPTTSPPSAPTPARHPPTARSDARERAALHDARADELEARGELSLRLGRDPVPPRARQRPRTAPARAPARPLQHCMLDGLLRRRR